MSERRSASAAQQRQWVNAAREQQQARFDGRPVTCNANMTPAHIREFCDLDETGNR